MTETSVLHQAGAEIISLRADNDRLHSELAAAHVINHEFDDKLVAARAELATLRLYADEVTRDSNRELAAKDARIAQLEANAVETELEWSKLAAERERAIVARAESAEAALAGTTP